MTDPLRTALEAEQRRVAYMRSRHPRLSLEDPTPESMLDLSRRAFWFAASVGERRHDLQWAVVIDGDKE